ncbi:hypothetical protein E8E95_12335 [Pseudomonas sp. BN414]|uniref:hypothetical protein n=1 Tax=Pseudomonas sp. BN414 TaxID=2567888 RepID=UPI002455742C|nr:hypothetical protein [Pseudomonas sp. BN414]MDH4567470.1 hypothetical protein [Pseudomonas sp. BN414]
MHSDPKRPGEAPDRTPPSDTPRNVPDTDVEPVEDTEQEPNPEGLLKEWNDPEDDPLVSGSKGRNPLGEGGP